MAAASRGWVELPSKCPSCALFKAAHQANLFAFELRALHSTRASTHDAIGSRVIRQKPLGFSRLGVKPVQGASLLAVLRRLSLAVDHTHSAHDMVRCCMIEAAQLSVTLCGTARQTTGAADSDA
eukprot:6183470-Pleurochrysis_carterae.AAC.2